MNRKIWILVALVSLSVLLFLSFFSSNYLKHLPTGELAPGFSLPDLSGQERSLEEFKGQVVLLNFWATWCGPCRHEMPSLEALHRKYRDRGFTVLGLSLDTGGRDDIEPFLKKIPLSFPILLDNQFKVSDRYGFHRIPESVLLDRNGKIIEVISGPQEWDQQKFWEKIETALSLDL